MLQRQLLKSEWIIPIAKKRILQVASGIKVLNHSRVEQGAAQQQATTPPHDVWTSFELIKFGEWGKICTVSY